MGKRANSTDDPNAKNPPEFNRFTDFARQILSVPHSEIKAQLDAEKAAKQAPKSVSRALGASSSHS